MVSIDMVPGRNIIVRVVMFFSVRKNAIIRRLEFRSDAQCKDIDHTIHFQCNLILLLRLNERTKAALLDATCLYHLSSDILTTCSGVRERFTRGIKGIKKPPFPSPRVFRHLRHPGNLLGSRRERFTSWNKGIKKPPFPSPKIFQRLPARSPL
eukprot:scaffold33515_cov144-Skeletonema_dohrnii-CCMP3373.AAC.2